MLLGVNDAGVVLGCEDRENIEEWVANIVRNNVVPALRPEIILTAYSGKQIVVIEVPQRKR